MSFLLFGRYCRRPRKLDEDRSMHWFAPRKTGSKWSRLNKERVTRLTAAGLMAPAGQEKIDAAIEDGSWQVLDAVEAGIIPDDLAAEFATYGQAREIFEAFPPSVRRSILEWNNNAKRPPTRAKRIEETARLAQDNIRANQWRG